MNKEQAVMVLWDRWFEDGKGLDFDTWMDLHGKEEAIKIRDKHLKPKRDEWK